LKIFKIRKLFAEERQKVEEPSCPKGGFDNAENVESAAPTVLEEPA